MSRTVRLIYANAGPGHTPLGFWTGHSFSGNPSHGHHIPDVEGLKRQHMEAAELLARKIGTLVCGGNLAGVWFAEVVLP